MEVIATPCAAIGALRIGTERIGRAADAGTSATESERTIFLLGLGRSGFSAGAGGQAEFSGGFSPIIHGGGCTATISG